MGFKWEHAWLSNGIHTYSTDDMLMLVMVCSLSSNGMSGVYNRFCKDELRIGLGWGYLVFCEAHPLLH